MIWNPEMTQPFRLHFLTRGPKHYDERSLSFWDWKKSFSLSKEEDLVFFLLLYSTDTERGGIMAKNYFSYSG